MSEILWLIRDLIALLSLCPVPTPDKRQGGKGDASDLEMILALSTFSGYLGVKIGVWALLIVHMGLRAVKLRDPPTQQFQCHIHARLGLFFNQEM